MTLSRVEIVRELEDKIPCPSCGSHWLDPVILGKDDWLIPAMGLEPRPPSSADRAPTDLGPTEQVRCHACGADPEIDVMSIVRAIDELDVEDEIELARMIGFKRELVGALLRGESVATPFGLFFGRAWAPKLEAVPEIEGFVRITARRTPQFLPSETFLCEVSEHALPAEQIRRAMERSEAGGFWDIDRSTFCEVATGLDIPKPDRWLDAQGLYDDVLGDLRGKRCSTLRGLGSWVIRRVGDRRAPRELVEFSFWRGLVHVVDQARSRQGPPSRPSGVEQPEVVYVFFDHARSASDPRRGPGSSRGGIAPRLQKGGEAASS